MAGTVKCKYCDSTILTSDKHCPNCGAPNEGYVDDSKAIITDPKTIDELKEYCAERGMPLVKMRFFIGEDIKEPRAFGIYKERNGECVVYKNKDDGSRAVRYRGFDEAFAVGEIFQKLLEECHKRGIYPDGKSADAQRKSQGQKVRINKGGKDAKVGWITAIAIVVLAAAPWVLLLAAPVLLIAYGIYKIAKKSWTFKGVVIWLIVTVLVSCFAGTFGVNLIRDAKYPSGYYQNDDTVYYNYSGDWYATDYGSNDWYPVYGNDAYDTLTTSDYVDSSYYDSSDDDWDFVQFSDSPEYDQAVEKASENSSSDSWSSSSSDYDSWDSGSTDWGSDW